MKNTSTCNYEWNSWTSIIPIQTYWKRRVGYLTKSLLGNPESILDVGCGSSRTISLFHCSRMGVDGSKEKLDYLKSRTNIDTCQADLELGIPLDNEYDAIICNNVLEHLVHFENILDDISRLLIVKGRTIITVPNYTKSHRVRLLEWIYNKFMPWGFGYDHVVKFTEESLDSLCKSRGLKLVTRKAVITDMVCLYEKCS